MTFSPPACSHCCFYPSSLNQSGTATTPDPVPLPRRRRSTLAAPARGSKLGPARERSCCGLWRLCPGSASASGLCRQLFSDCAVDPPPPEYPARHEFHLVLVLALVLAGVPIPLDERVTGRRLPAAV